MLRAHLNRPIRYRENRAAEVRGFVVELIGNEGEFLRNAGSVLRTVPSCVANAVLYRRDRRSG